MFDNKKLISKKKPFFKISEKLEDFLKTHDRWIDDVISYEDLSDFQILLTFMIKRIKIHFGLDLFLMRVKD